MTILLDQQLKKIKSMAEKKALELEELQYEKYNVYFKSAIKFLKKEKVLMYGGSAINDLMPAKYKFYSERSLPDRHYTD